MGVNVYPPIYTLNYKVFYFVISNIALKIMFNLNKVTTICSITDDNYENGDSRRY